jgi:hypothetical protein
MNQNNVDNVLKIIDENNRFRGTGFLIFENYIVTCHHCIFTTNKIYVESNNKKYPVEWEEYFSSPEKDIAVLRVSDIGVSPVKPMKQTPPGIQIYIQGYSGERLDHFRSSETIEGKLYSHLNVFSWEEGKYIGKNKWNSKPPVEVDVFRLEGTFDMGFSGSPVFYGVNNEVVGMFTAKEKSYGYIIPIEIILQKFLEPKKEISLFISKPSIENLNPNQKIMWNKLKEVIDNKGIIINYLEPEEYSNLFPIQKVKKVIERCHGVIILGFKQFYITNGIKKMGSENESQLKNYFLPTEWNNLEAGLAYVYDLPILIICEIGIGGGVFDDKMTEFKIYRFRSDSKNWHKSKVFIGLLNEWFKKVLDYKKENQFQEYQR